MTNRELRTGRRICFLLGSPAISGGTYVIYQHALYAQRNGWDVTIVSHADTDAKTIAWHPEASELRFKKYHEVANEQFDLAIATWWRTTFELHNIDAARYAYFVQSIESRFVNSTEEPLRDLSENTYLLEIGYITEVEWIKSYLEAHFGRIVELSHNGIRKDIYEISGATAAPRLERCARFLVEGPMNVPFKNTERALELCRGAGVSDLWLLSSSELKNYPGCSRVFSRVPIDKVAEIYRSCDVLVKLSYVEGMFGPPLEMFHCGGTAIAYSVTGHEVYMHHEQNSLLADVDDELAIVRHIHTLRDDSRLLEKLRRGAVETASHWPSWEKSSATFLGGITRIIERELPGKRTQIKFLTDAIKSTYVTAERYRLELQKNSTGGKQLAPSSRYVYPEGRILNELEAKIQTLEAENMRLRGSASSPADGRIAELEDIIKGQEKLMVERWDTMQEMGRLIYERDQEIERLKAAVRSSPC